MNGAALLDTVLDRTILGGYTSVGYHLRALRWNDRELARMDARTVVISGATSGIGFLRTAAQGADAIVWLAASPQGAASSGGFWHDRRRRPTHILPGTSESSQERERLWSECERLSAGS